MTDVERYDYDLPEDLIAQQPLSRRSDARLLVVDRATETIEHAYVRDLAEFLEAGDTLVLNDSRVIPAKLVGYRTRTGGKWQGLYLGSDEHAWRILGRTRGKLEVGETLTLVDRNAQPDTVLHLLTQLEHGQWAARAETDLPAVELLEEIGRVPLPHYIRDGNMVPADLKNYQTVFAASPGSIAAPTAGLHFTPELLLQLEEAGIGQQRVTLHVGLGTFRPISTADLESHQMHSEWATISADTAAALVEAQQRASRIVAVGSTTVRTLETAAAAHGKLAAWSGGTDLFIKPPYEFLATSALLTNFHLPRSTLLVLVRTFGGDDLIREAYEVAIREQYRFYSYGDAMLIR